MFFSFGAAEFEKPVEKRSFFYTAYKGIPAKIEGKPAGFEARINGFIVAAKRRQ